MLLMEILKYLLERLFISYDIDFVFNICRVVAVPF